LESKPNGTFIAVHCKSKGESDLKKRIKGKAAAPKKKHDPYIYELKDAFKINNQTH